MNWNLLRQTLSDRWRSTAIYAGGIAAYALLSASMFPTIKNMKGAKEMLEKMPKGFMKFFGAEQFDMTSYNNYMVTRMLGLILVVIIGAYVISFARAMVAGELSDGTLELLLAQPIERWKIITTRGLALLGGIVGLVLATVLSCVVFGAVFKANITYGGYFAYIPLGVALFAAIAGYSVLFSAIFNSPARAAMAAAGLTLFFYILQFVGTYSKVLEKVAWFGIFHYYDPLKVLTGGNVPVRDVIVLLAFALVGFAAAIPVFQRKDIAAV